MDLQELVLKYKETNNGTLLDKIIEVLNPFIYKHTSRLLRLLPIEFDDIKQEVMIVILKRIKTYNSAKGKFLTYLMNTFQGDPTKTLQRLKCKKRGGDGKSHYIILESLQRVINKEDGTTLEEIIPDKKDILGEINYTILKALRDNLTDEEQKVFDILYKEPEFSDNVIANILNLRSYEISKLRKTIRIKCKEMVIAGR
jgi:RNA polymerase sigma factor (sigma-70 family)